MDKEIIKNKLVKLFNDMFEKNIDENLMDRHLLDSRINIKPRDLVYYLLEIEKEFCVKISEEDIGTGRFSSINKIADIIIATKNIN